MLKMFKTNFVYNLKLKQLLKKLCLFINIFHSQNFILKIKVSILRSRNLLRHKQKPKIKLIYENLKRLNMYL